MEEGLQLDLQHHCCCQRRCARSHWYGPLYLYLCYCYLALETRMAIEWPLLGQRHYASLRFHPMLPPRKVQT